MIAGFGFRATATEASLRDALARAGGAGCALVALAVPEDKAGAACLAGLAQALGAPVVAVPADALRAEPTATRSPRVFGLRGIGSVAEAAALAAAGQGARLVGPRVVSGDRLATCALALAAVETQNVEVP